MSFEAEQASILAKAKVNLHRRNEARQALEAERRNLLPFAYAEREKQIEDAYQATRRELFKAHHDAIGVARAEHLRDLRTLTKGVSEADWFHVVKDADSETLAAGMQRAVKFGDRLLARGLAIRVYDRFLETGATGDMSALQQLAEVDPFGVGRVAAFEAEHGALRSREQKVMGPLAGL